MPVLQQMLIFFRNDGGRHVCPQKEYADKG